MKAIVMTATGGPEVLQLQDIDKPAIVTPTGVLVKLKAAGINPVDTKLRRGLYPIEQLPAVLGCDGAGVVEAIGTGVTRCKAGDEVYFFHGGIGTVPGNYAEYIVLDERLVARKPESLDFIQAAAAPLVLLTAWESLYDRARLQAGQTVLIHAGAGGVGHVAIQLARQSGALVCTTVGSAEKATFVKELGAERAINYKEQDFVKAVLDWTHGHGVDIAMDNVGGAMIEATFPAVRHYGDMVTLLQPSADVNWTVARQRNLRFSMEIMLSPLLFNLVEAQIHQTWILEQCARLFDAGKLAVHVSRVLPLAKAAEAHAEIEKGSATGKLVLTIG
ncbi:MAG: alcohol dehydrogenase [Gammaproteobacteria bacterium RBG_16_51_14]|nr:MAG: alcohol dehydrogenase [Gammaproteobacteria bacterium RBG_16_51_14]